MRAGMHDTDIWDRDTNTKNRPKEPRRPDRRQTRRENDHDEEI